MRAVAALLQTDLRQLLRSRRALLVGILLPIAVWPAVLLISQRVSQQQRERLDQTVYLWAVGGPEADALRSLVALAEAAGPADDGTSAAGTAGATTTDAAGGAPLGEPLRLGLREVVPAPADFRAAIDDATLHLYVEALPAGSLVAAPTPEPADRRRQDGAAARPQDAAARHMNDAARQNSAAPRQEPVEPSLEPSTVPVFRVHFRADRDLSREALDRLGQALDRANEVRREHLLEERGFRGRPSRMGAIETRDLASAAESTGLQLGRFISALLVSLLLAGGSVVASDSLAGEKERGTLETLLTTAVSRGEIVLAKQLSILLVALGMTALQLAAIWVYIGSGVIDLPEGVTIALTPGLALLLFFLYLPVAALVASALLLASAYSKSYKEAQLYFMPVFVLGIAPTLAPVLPGASLRSILVLAPIANLSLAVKDILAGNPDPLMTAVAWLVTAAAAVALGLLSSRLLTKEGLITSVQHESSGGLGGPQVFGRDVLRWAAAAWALVLVASLFLGTGEHILERQLAVNMSVLLGLAFFLLRRYRLPARETLSLRLPSPTAWLAVAIGAPSGLLVAQLLVQATARFLPVPEEVLRQFVEQLLPADVPTWKLVLLLVLLPATVEEIFFRGIVLSGLGAQRTAVRVLVSAIAFGLFHVSFFRLLPTTFLGVMLALTTLWSGSIFPAMAWHAANNGLAALVFEDVETLPLWASVAAVPGLAIALWLLWRGRRRGATSSPPPTRWRRRGRFAGNTR